MNQGRDYQHPHVGDDGRQLANPEKLMLDAFKGLKPSGSEGGGTESKARKALMFEESNTGDASGEGVIEDVKSTNTEEMVMDGVQVKRVPEGIMREENLDEETAPSQALDDANLMIEGEILSDSELMVDEDMNGIQEWEVGEITDLMEEEVAEKVAEKVEEKVAAELVELGDANQGNAEETKEKALKKKATKPATLAVGGATKTLLAQQITSPRKKTTTKTVARTEAKGVTLPKKGPTKP